MYFAKGVEWRGIRRVGACCNVCWFGLSLWCFKVFSIAKATINWYYSQLYLQKYLWLSSIYKHTVNYLIILFFDQDQEPMCWGMSMMIFMSYWQCVWDGSCISVVTIVSNFLLFLRWEDALSLCLIFTYFTLCRLFLLRLSVLLVFTRCRLDKWVCTWCRAKKYVSLQECYLITCHY